MQSQQSDYARIEAAIHYLTINAQAQPSLADVAAHVHLSPHHLQRLFRRWAGVSPKRFLQFLTLRHAQAMLDAAHSVLEASYAAGLSGPGRLHDLFVTIDAVTPGEYKAAGAGLRIDWGIQATPFGDALLAVTERGVCGLAFLDSGGVAAALADLRRRWPLATLVENGAATAVAAAHIFPADPATGRRAVTLFVQGTNFQLQVWQALLHIPGGGVWSYGDVARHIERPRAVRAVGSAVGANPVAYLVPCHRVIQAGGAPGNYRWGEPRKRALLGWESARFGLPAAAGAAIGGMP